MPTRTKLIIGIVALILLAGGGWYWTSENSKFEANSPVIQSIYGGDWKLYSNAKYAFEFRYPKELVMRPLKPKGDAPLGSSFWVEFYDLRQDLESSHDLGIDIGVYVIKAGTSFPYEVGNDAVYDKESNTLRVFDGDTQKTVTTLRPAIHRNNWSGFVDELYENMRPYLGRIFIPTETKDFILYVSVRDNENLENMELPKEFWNNFKFIEK